MVVAVAAGASGSGARSWDIFAPGQTLTAAMASLAIGSDQVRGDDLAFPSLFFLGAVLFAMTFLLNVIGDVFVRRTRQRY
jgi:phosphate transport system permease protein